MYIPAATAVVLVAVCLIIPAQFATAINGDQPPVSNESIGAVNSNNPRLWSLIWIWGPPMNLTHLRLKNRQKFTNENHTVTSKSKAKRKPTTATPIPSQSERKLCNSTVARDGSSTTSPEGTPLPAKLCRKVHSPVKRLNKLIQSIGIHCTFASFSLSALCCTMLIALCCGFRAGFLLLVCIFLCGIIWTLWMDDCSALVSRRSHSLHPNGTWLRYRHCTSSTMCTWKYTAVDNKDANDNSTMKFRIIKHVFLYSTWRTMTSRGHVIGTIKPLT